MGQFHHGVISFGKHRATRFIVRTGSSERSRDEALRAVVWASGSSAIALA
jgi:hypothetical protein